MRAELGFDPSDGVTTADWLLTPSQRLLAVTAGDVFADPTGELTAARNALHWCPHDVWLLVMAGYWRRIAQLEHFVGRTAAVGDELGSRLVAASLVRDLIRLAFLQERRYAPYPKWLSAAFATLARPEALALAGALAADDPRLALSVTRERGAVALVGAGSKLPRGARLTLQVERRGEPAVVVARADATPDGSVHAATLFRPENPRGRAQLRGQVRDRGRVVAERLVPFPDTSR